MENLTGGTPPVRYLLCVVPCKLYFCGGKIFGVVGVLLAIPFAAIVQYLMEEILFPKVREERKESDEEGRYEGEKDGNV